MASGLGFTAYYSRNIIRWFAIGVLIYLIGYVLWIILQPYFQREPPPPPIEIRFEISSTINFPPPDPALQFSYRLETATGTLPLEPSDRVVVFKNEYKPVSFFAFDEAVKQVKNLGFLNPAIPVSPPIYQWKKIDALPGLLEINITTGELDLIKNWRADPNVFISTKRITEVEAFRMLEAEFGRAKLMNEDLKKGDHKLIYFKVFNDQLQEVASISQADMIQVNFRRAKINELEIVYTDPDRPPVWGLVTRTGEVLELHFHYWPIGTVKSEYPIRKMADVWSDLLSGKAHIARIGGNLPGQEVVIRHFSVGYYISNDFQLFTEPVYVIRGDNDFMAYVPATDRTLK